MPVPSRVKTSGEPKNIEHELNWANPAQLVLVGPARTLSSV